jgi:hypothetical protein
VHGSVILARPVAREGDPAGPDRGRKRRVDAALEIKEGAPMDKAVRLQPRDPPRVAGVAVDLVMAPLAEPRDERLQGGPRAIAGIDQQDRFAALAAAA